MGIAKSDIKDIYDLYCHRLIFKTFLDADMDVAFDLTIKCCTRNYPKFSLKDVMYISSEFI